MSAPSHLPITRHSQIHRGPCGIYLTPFPVYLDVSSKFPDGEPTRLSVNKNCVLGRCCCCDMEFGLREVQLPVLMGPHQLPNFPPAQNLTYQLKHRRRSHSQHGIQVIRPMADFRLQQHVKTSSFCSNPCVTHSKHDSPFCRRLSRFLLHLLISFSTKYAHAQLLAR